MQSEHMNVFSVSGAEVSPHEVDNRQNKKRKRVRGKLNSTLARLDEASQHI